MKCIYLRTNLINGKQYVGQTNDFKQREKEWKYLNGRYSSGIIDNARKKYGLENFKTEILKECSTQDEPFFVIQPNLSRSKKKERKTDYTFQYLS